MSCVGNQMMLLETSTATQSTNNQKMNEVPCKNDPLRNVERKQFVPTRNKFQLLTIDDDSDDDDSDEDVSSEGGVQQIAPLASTTNNYCGTRRFNRRQRQRTRLQRQQHDHIDDESDEEHDNSNVSEWKRKICEQQQDDHNAGDDRTMTRQRMGVTVEHVDQRQCVFITTTITCIIGTAQHNGT